MTTFEVCYVDPLSADGNWLCHLYLMFAIGLVLATPVPGSNADAVFQRLKLSSANRTVAPVSNYAITRAESFYKTARESCKDPYALFEDSDFWSVVSFDRPLKPHIIS